MTMFQVASTPDSTEDTDDPLSDDVIAGDKHIEEISGGTQQA